MHARYAYSDEAGEEADDEETISLTKVVTEGDISLAKRDTDKHSSHADGFSHDDDVEEDKRE